MTDMNSSLPSDENLTKIEFTLSVLGYIGDDGTHISHCLEMDIKGYGENREEAFGNLLDLVEMQISFALQRNKPGLIYNPAEKELFQIFAKLKNEKLRAFPQIPKISDYFMYEIPMPKPRNEV